VTDAGDRPWAVSADGLVVTVRLTPKGGRDAIEGIDQMADGRSVVKARVRAAASEGEANAALVSLIARTLAVPPSRVTLIAGAAARIKRLNVMGDTGAIAAALERIMGVVK
jgi:uncharacterized protein (TIGR00251 family)